MLTSSIVLIIVRLFAVQWALNTLAWLLELYPALVKDPKFLLGLYLAMLVGMLVCAAVMWCFAPAFSRWVAGKQDATAAVSGLTLEDLYSFGFTFIGLYFMLKSLGDLANWLHYSLVVAASRGDSDPSRPQSLYHFSGALITFLAALACFVSGRKWAKKMCNP